MKGTNPHSSNRNQPEQVRLNKYISNSGICSRREADKFIEAGVVSVNGKVITEMGYKIQKTDIVKFNDSTIKSQQHKYLLLNKPKNYTSSFKDSFGSSCLLLISTDCGSKFLDFFPKIIFPENFDPGK